MAKDIFEGRPVPEKGFEPVKVVSQVEASASESDNRRAIALSVLNICSEEQAKDGQSGLNFYYFNNITLSVCSKEIWGISSNDAISVRLLCQTLGNMHGYRKGMLRYGSLVSVHPGRGEKPLLFYIDTHEMLQSDKNVLQQLIFASGKKQKIFKAAEIQSKMLYLLEKTGMGHIALTNISDLLDTEKILVELLIASASDSMLIVCDATDYTFTKQEIEILSNIAIRLRYLGKALIIGSLQPELIEAACDSTLFLVCGESVYSGSVEELKKTVDKISFIIKDENSQLLGMLLSSLLPGWRVKVSGEELYLLNYTDKHMSIEEFHALLARNRLSPDHVIVNSGSVASSFEELVGRHDIQSGTL